MATVFFLAVWTEARHRGGRRENGRKKGRERGEEKENLPKDLIYLV